MITISPVDELVNVCMSADEDGSEIVVVVVVVLVADDIRPHHTDMAGNRVAIGE